MWQVVTTTEKMIFICCCLEKYSKQHYFYSDNVDLVQYSGGERNAAL
jgi:hypothetical protein